MLRRLFFLLPDEANAPALVADLKSAGIGPEHLHAVAGAGQQLQQFPPATQRQQRDSVWRIEHWLWNGNLALFATAAFGLVLALYAGHALASVVSVAIMIATFTAGVVFVYRMPDTHLGELSESLKHGDIVLMVDVPKGRADEINQLVRERHPEAEANGIGWTIERLGI